MTHRHTATPETRAHVYEACACGAVRKLTGGQYDQWHACELCSRADTWRDDLPDAFEESLQRHAAACTGHPDRCDCRRCATIRRDERRARARRIVPLAAQADTEYTSRIDAQRVTLELAQRSTQRVDAGRESIEDSPLWGGTRQGDLFAEDTRS